MDTPICSASLQSTKQLAGYDVRSKISSDDHSALLIEVKTSTSSLEQAYFHVTSHEWKVAQTSLAYVFHLWCLSGKKRLLAIISPEDIFPYIPTNNLSGEWESAKIPFLSFKSSFVEIA
ncbi:protein NO VEIN domain-containing protein [Candidatus Allofournierella merdipullorum]|uniref:protein NO VEIN domain-containing protein n=1 Tax=Candidatus Allofournierella merdipullorum TaxID=2838595 RepID=UPI00374EBC76